ncbi:hypothetical protein GCM10009596_30200 [Arthrobacter rhombi]
MSTERCVRTISVPGDVWMPPWPNAFELADAVPSRHWTLVGGLMVQLHCIAAGVTPPRPTFDVDTLIHVELPGNSLSVLHEGLVKINYSPQLSLGRRQPLHRYVRGNDVIDFLIADHAAPSLIRKFPSLGVVRASGGTNALRRTVQFDIVHEHGRSSISCPDVVGALMLKADAYRIDSRDRLRHLQDSVSLAILLSESTKGPKMFGSGPRRIRQLLKALSAYRPEQLGVTEDDWQDAQIALQELLEWR